MDKNTLSALRAKAFKYRGGVWTALFVVILVLAHPVPGRIAVGIILVVLGQLLRFWGAGCIKRYRGEQVKAEELATWGPYALVRNPLYVGNGLIGLGWGWIAGPWATAVFCVTFWVLYDLLIVPHEEEFLRGKFGAEYENYCARVGRFFPKSLSRDTLAHVRAGSYDASILLKSEIHSLWVHIVGSIAIISRLWW